MIKPMLAEDLAHFDRKPPWGSEDWAMEIKVDGIRLLWTNEDGGARYYARSGNEHTGRYPFLSGLSLPPDTMLDGELAVPLGVSSDAAALTNRGQLVYTVFDVLSMDGHELGREPWTVRREVLEMGLFAGVERVDLSEVLPPDEDVALRLMEAGHEGVILKRRNAGYQEGIRSWDWLKRKAAFDVDAVIVDCEGSPTKGSLGDSNGWVCLSYGFCRDGGLVRAGTVGQSEPREIQQAKVGRVAVIRCNGINAETGALRHPRIIRFRSDKLADECGLPK